MSFTVKPSQKRKHSHSHPSTDTDADAQEPAPDPSTTTKMKQLEQEVFGLLKKIEKLETDAESAKKNNLRKRDDPMKDDWTRLYYNICRLIPNLETKLNNKTGLSNPEEIKTFCNFSNEIKKMLIEERPQYAEEMEKNFLSRMKNERERYRKKQKTHVDVV